MALTDIKIKTAKSKDKDYKLGDNGGLFLVVTIFGNFIHDRKKHAR